MVRDEPRRVSCYYDVLAEPPVDELAYRCDDVRVGIAGRNQLDERQVTWRVEEVRAEPVAPKIVTPPLGEPCDREPRGIRAHNRSGAAHGVHARKQLALGIRSLDDRFNDPVRRCDLRELIVKPAGAYQRN